MKILYLIPKKNDLRSHYKENYPVCMLDIFCDYSQYFSFFKIFIYLFILAALGLHCCVRAFSSCGERGLLFVAVHRLLIAVACLVAQHGLQ